MVPITVFQKWFGFEFRLILPHHSYTLRDVSVESKWSPLRTECDKVSRVASC